MAQLLGFEGAAGTGKTYCLMEAVRSRLVSSPLEGYQRVLALSFMHGSRRRLDERLSKVPGLGRRYECRTIDSFAMALLRRWRSLAETLGLQGATFDEKCASGAELLKYPVVARWVARTHPVLIVDEAQELSPERLEIVRALAAVADTYLAADEFQCLTETVDTSPFMEWMHSGQVVRLSEPKRTSVAGLLEAAGRVRAGEPPVRGRGIDFIYSFPRNAPFAVGQALRAVQRSAALIAAPGAPGWARSIVQRLQSGMKSAKQSIPPIRIAWEVRAEDEVERILAALPEADSYSVEELVTSIRQPAPELPGWAPDVARAVQRNARVTGRTRWSLEEVKALVSRRGALVSARGRRSHRAVPALSIHGAKNREFEHVVVLWPHGVRGTDEHKRRLLYNAITRAQKTCKVFVQGEELLKAPPFGPSRQ